MRKISYLNLLVFCLLCTVGCSAKSHQIQISSEPSGVDVYLQNNLLGKTPLEAAVQQQAGDYNVYNFRAEKDDYMPNRKFFKEEFYDDTAADVVPPKVNFVMVKRKKYPILITSDPSGATLIFNGKVIGKTPMTVTAREHIGTPRLFKFTVRKKGFSSKEIVLEEYIAKDDETPFEFPESIHFEL